MPVGNLRYLNPIHQRTIWSTASDEIHLPIIPKLVAIQPEELGEPNFEHCVVKRRVIGDRFVPAEVHECEHHEPIEILWPLRKTVMWRNDD